MASRSYRSKRSQVSETCFDIMFKMSSTAYLGMLKAEIPDDTYVKQRNKKKILNRSTIRKESGKPKKTQFEKNTRAIG